MKVELRGVSLLLTWLLCTASAFADKPLVARLNSADQYDVLDGLRDLQFVGRQYRLSVKQRLIELVDHPNADVRVDALRQLAEIGAAAADASDAITPRLRDEDPECRLAAADALAKVADRIDLAAAVYVEALKTGADLQDDNRKGWLVEHAGQELQWLGPAAAIELPALLELLNDPHEIVRAEAASVLGALGPQYRQQVERQLTAALADPAGKVRLAAAVAINQIGAPVDQAVQTLIQLAQEEIPASDEAANSFWAENFLASTAVKALGELEGDAAPAVPALGALLKSPVLAVRLEAATALGKIGTAAQPAAPALAAALQETEGHSAPFLHHSWCVGENAAVALGQIGAADALLTALNDKQPMIRARAAKTLGEIPAAAPQTVGPLSQLLQDPEPFVRINATKGLAKLGPAAAAATPDLIRLLVNPLGVTSFPAGMGIGLTESTSAEAWRALQKINPTAEQANPALIESLQSANRLSYETICALREYRPDSAAVKEPLERLLQQKDTRVAAACALAFVAPDHDEIAPILRAAVFAEEPELFAAWGLDQLVAAGQTLDADYQARLRKLAADRSDLLLWLTLYRLSPNDRQTTQSLVAALAYGHPTFDHQALAESRRFVLQQIGAQPLLREALVGELGYVDPPNQAEEDFTGEQSAYRRLRAARLLIAANVAVEQAVACLAALVADDQMSGSIETVEILTQETPPAAAIPLLTLLLDDNERYTSGGDFYGNGGEWRVTGDRAAVALSKLKATAALLGKLDSEDPLVRERVVRMLGELDEAAAVNALLSKTADLDVRVRRATMTALGEQGKSNPALRPQLRPVLEQAADDSRQSVRDAAGQALRNWQ
ncbi:HEAT repeat domain-containing protein [Blastopirellula marina]|nr:HEAT repeat domain-containing protein [Blastopirellula marina]